MAFSQPWSYSKLALLGFFYSTALLTCSFSFKAQQEELNVKRSDFARDFLFGVSSSAVQEDVKLVKDLGVDSYRLSISWTRILPNGSLSGGVNKEGIDHYNSLIDLLIKYGIKPFVTMVHFDFPQVLEEKYGGPLSHRFVNDFKDYAKILFRTYGDKVKTWVTINEPLITAKYGYDLGFPPPSRCSDRKTCKAGNSSTEPYTVAHNFLLAHATAASLHRRKFQPKQGGQIGVSVSAQYYKPYSKSLQDKAAAKRGLDFEIGCVWTLSKDHEKNSQGRLPKFTAKEKKLVRGSVDFMGLNYYTAIYVKGIPINFHASQVSINGGDAKDNT
ncbi:hypothetical protein Ddye_025279 [Dipteronia dyeriana]|uniref:Beta-glucosidase n=1 Tax=Dipteronia dyeriana TaxID=168575 RepID=A0AAD9WUD2_9ROSI|nr:hypothetical protein Ddye_025279 [Dipteronia dyeriana]